MLELDKNDSRTLRLAGEMKLLLKACRASVCFRNDSSWRVWEGG